MKNHSVLEAVEALVSAASHAGYLEPELAKCGLRVCFGQRRLEPYRSAYGAIEKKLPALRPEILKRLL